MNGLPYMGSKRKIASEIVSCLVSRHPSAVNFYDVFGGGGSISLEALKYKHLNVHYNELNTAIYSLLKHLKENKTLGSEFYRFIKRDEFFEQLTKNDYFAGYVQCCWSFGNKQTSYLYGKDIEESKEDAHKLIVDLCFESAQKLQFEHFEELSKIKDIQKRRKVFCKFQKNNLQNLQYIENLGRIQELERIQEIELTNLSFENLSFENLSLIYCDPPYKGTGEYKEGGFNHNKFYEWFASLPHPAYMSEYDAPFEQIEQFHHRSTFSASNNKRVVKEKLFWNGVGYITNYKLFS